MTEGFDIHAYKNWSDLLFRGAFENAGPDLLTARIFGHTDPLSASTAEDVWESGDTKTLLSTAQTLDIVSDNTNDTLSGTGAWYVMINGLDGDYNTITETVTMNGTSTVTTTQEFLRINRLRSVFHGTGQINAGAITCISSTSSDLQGTIFAGEGISHNSHVTIPAGYTGFVTDIALTCFRSSGSGTRRANVDLKAYIPAANAKYTSIKYGVSSDSGGYRTDNKLLAQSPEKTTLWFEANAEANNTQISTSMGLVMVRGDYNFRTEF